MDSFVVGNISVSTMVPFSTVLVAWQIRLANLLIHFPRLVLRELIAL
jgi:hypothetical protein